MLALAALTCMWGLNWPLMKFSLRELSPLYFRALTMTGGALWLYFYFRARGIRMTPSGREWRSIVQLGSTNMFGWHCVSILGVKELASGRAAVLGFTMPVWTVLLGAWLFGERLTARAVFATLSVAVAIGLLLAHEFTALSGRPLGVLWMECGALLWAIGTLMMRRSASTLPVQALTVWMMILSSLALWALAFAFEPWPAWRFSTGMWLSLAYGVVINYGIAQVIWFGLARDLPPTTSAMSIMAIPLIGTLSATFIVAEWPHWQDLVAALFVTAAIACVLLPPRKTP
ncbi:MAG: DMT family transporter [Betaproteobacteria bacterium]|nr:DMT family transporter [Betaproteobacteria bacterium]NBS45904.1 DMT family transporter [Betaproteobacteria bacterium]